MKRKLFCLLVFTFAISALPAQETGYETLDLGGEFQWYPAGTITGLHLAKNFRIHHGIHLRIAYNKANRKDFGEHPSETGGGWGGTLGYRYYFRYKPHGFFAGLRTDFWKMKITWADEMQEGVSRVSVIQPTLELGYLFLLNDQFFITPTISNGFEINMKTEGEKVGDGFVTLLGISAGFRF